MAGTDILLDSTTHDIDLTNNTMTLIDTVEGLARQRVDITLRMFKGEWEFNILEGISYIRNKNNTTQLLGVGRDNKRLLDFEIRNAILNKDEILSITSFESTVDRVSRIYSLTCTAVTEQGTITFGTAFDI